MKNDIFIQQKMRIYDSHILVLLLLIPPFECTLGPLCFSCSEEIKTTTCDHAKRCSPHETCALERGVNLFGEVLFWSGCKDRTYCSGRKRDGSLTDVRVDCAECCDGDFCNQKGCGEQGYQQGSSLGPLCLSCDTISSPSKCEHVRRCNQNEVCYIETKIVNNTIGYSVGCRNYMFCQTQSMTGGCNSCCSGDLCNTNCSSLSGASTMAPPGVTHITKTILQQSSSTITSWNSIPTATNKLTCLNCSDALSLGPWCTSTHCEANEFCYASADIKFGLTVYNLGCKSKVLCASHPFGKRQQTLSYYVRCCSTDNCNFKEYDYLKGLMSLNSTTTVASVQASKPIIVRAESSANITKINSNVTMTCQASGYPIPNIYWTVPAQHGHPMLNYDEPKNGQISITYVQRENQGYYSCVAENDQGRDIKGIYLTVL